MFLAMAKMLSSIQGKGQNLEDDINEYMQSKNKNLIDVINKIEAMNDEISKLSEYVNVTMADYLETTNYKNYSYIKLFSEFPEVQKDRPILLKYGVLKESIEKDDTGKITKYEILWNKSKQSLAEYFGIMAEKQKQEADWKLIEANF